MAESVSLKEHFEKILEEKDRANDQRFSSQEKATETQERTRDEAIKKAEDSIEKKSDAVYVKLTDLQNAFSGVMLRPEVESRFASVAKDISEIKKLLDNSSGKSSGYSQFFAWIVAGIGIIFGVINYIK